VVDKVICKVLQRESLTKTEICLITADIVFRMQIIWDDAEDREHAEHFI